MYCSKIYFAFTLTCTTNVQTTSSSGKYNHPVLTAELSELQTPSSLAIMGTPGTQSKSSWENRGGWGARLHHRPVAGTWLRLHQCSQGTNLAGFEKTTTAGVCTPGKSTPLNHDPMQLMTGSSCCQQVTRQAGAVTAESSWPQSAHTHPDPCPGTSCKSDFPRRWQRQSKRWRHDHFAVPLAGCCCPRQQPTSPMLPAGPVLQTVLCYVFKWLY